VSVGAEVSIQIRTILPIISTRSPTRLQHCAKFVASTTSHAGTYSRPQRQGRASGKDDRAVRDVAALEEVFERRDWSNGAAQMAAKFRTLCSSSGTEAAG